jgi:hypothetical protein
MISATSCRGMASAGAAGSFGWSASVVVSFFFLASGGLRRSVSRRADESDSVGDSGGERCENGATDEPPASECTHPAQHSVMPAIKAALQRCRP